MILLRWLMTGIEQPAVSKAQQSFLTAVVVATFASSSTDCVKLKSSPAALVTRASPSTWSTGMVHHHRDGIAKYSATGHDDSSFWKR